MSGSWGSIFIIFILGIATVAVFRQLAIAFELVDRPDAIRKQHHGAIPLCGGIAIFTTFAATSLLMGQAAVLGVNFWLALAVLLLLGLLDDRRPLPAVGRLVMQLAMAVALVGGANIGSLSVGALLSQNAQLFLPLFFVVGVVFVTGLVNAWNMIDGVDGLAGGVTGVALIWLLVVADFAGMTELVPSLETLSVCLCAFLIFNMRSPWRKKASVFLGDAGSTALGATIAYVILLLATQSSAISFPALLWIVIIPVSDTLSLIVRRLAVGRNPMSADRWHLHHLLLDRGLSPASTTLALMAISGICGSIGYLGIRMHIPCEIMAAALLIPVSGHTAFVLAATGFLAKKEKMTFGGNRPDTLGSVSAGVILSDPSLPALTDE